MIHENVCRDESQRTGLYRDLYFPSCECPSDEKVSEEILDKVEKVLQRLITSAFEGAYREFNQILLKLKNAPTSLTAQRLRLLSFVLNEAARELSGYNEKISKVLETEVDTRTRRVLNLAKNFIQEWSEISSRIPRIEICRFCERLISEITCQRMKKPHRRYPHATIEHVPPSDGHYATYKTSKAKINDTDGKEFEVENICDNYTKVHDPKSTPAKSDLSPMSPSIVKDPRKTTSHPKDSRQINTKLPADFIRKPDVKPDKFSKIENRLVPRQEVTEETDVRRIITRKMQEKRDDLRQHKSWEIEDSDSTNKVGHRLRRREMKNRANESRAGRTVDNGDMENHGKRDASAYRTAIGSEAKVKSMHTAEERIEDRARGRDSRGGREKFYSEERTAEKANGGRVDRGKAHDHKERPTGRPAGMKIRKDTDKEEEMVSLSKSKEVRERSKKKADALDSERRGVSYNVDEEGKLLKGGEKQRGRLRGERKEIDDSDLTKTRETSTGTNVQSSKSTYDSERRERRKDDGTIKKEVKILDSGVVLDDDHSKINGSRYQRKKRAGLKLCDVDMGPPNPIEYQLSNEHFVRLGWTVLPVTKTTRKVVRYEATLAKPRLNWFKKQRSESVRYYNDGTPLLTFSPDESGRLFYPNGKLAVKICRPKDRTYDMYTVFTTGCKDALGIERESQLIAVFDTTGDGAVFDENGEIRLSYSQVGGVCYDNPSGAPFIWTWNGYAREPIVETVYKEKSATRLEEFFAVSEKSLKSSSTITTPMSPSSARNEEKKVERQKPVVEEHQEKVESGTDVARLENCTPVKIICMKLNEHVSLRILDRKNINLQFFANGKSIRMELGTVLNHDKEVASHFTDSDHWKVDALKSRYEEKLSSDLESTSSLYELAKEYRRVRKAAKKRQALISKYKPFLKVRKSGKLGCKSM